MDELEAMLGKPDWKPLEASKMPKAIIKQPDTLVLINLTTNCRCGKRFETPNKWLMLRFGESFLGVKSEMWRSEYNGLPREVKEVETEVLTCQRCFHNSDFLSEDF